MTKIRVCSGFSPDGYRQYGRRFLETFDSFWPLEVELQVWTEEPVLMPREACRSLWDIPGAREFRDAYREDPAANGRLPQRIWKHAEIERGYSFRTDAYKFFKQILIPGASIDGLRDGDILVWLDADVVTLREVPASFVSDMLGDAEVCYLGRNGTHSEIGFWAIRLGDRTRAFLTSMAIWYTTGRVFELPEWHSAYVWDRARESMQLRRRNLCPPMARGHVWPLTPLARYTRHDKGPRKPR